MLILLTVCHTFQISHLTLTNFQQFPGPVALFQDFPHLENATVKFQVFQDPYESCVKMFMVFSVPAPHPLLKNHRVPPPSETINAVLFNLNPTELSLLWQRQRNLKSIEPWFHCFLPKNATSGHYVIVWTKWSNGLQTKMLRVHSDLWSDQPKTGRLENNDARPILCTKFNRTW